MDTEKNKEAPQNGTFYSMAPYSGARRNESESGFARQCKPRDTNACSHETPSRRNGRGEGDGRFMFGMFCAGLCRMQLYLLRVLDDLAAWQGQMVNCRRI